MFKFDTIVERYLSEGKKFHRPVQQITHQPANTSVSTSNNLRFSSSSVSQFRTKRFTKDIKDMDISNQRQALEFLRGWESGAISPEFEFKFNSPNGHLLVAASETTNNAVPQKLPLFAVTVRERTPALRFICTKIESKLIWLRAYLGKDEYDGSLTNYRSTNRH